MAPYKQQPKTSTSLTQIQAAAFSGPLPPPEILVKYNEAVPGAAERILAMAERQSAHRAALESALVHANIQSQNRGAIFGFIIAMTAILGGIYLIATGKSAQGLIAIITSLVALTAVFIYGKKKEMKQLEEKSKALERKRIQES